MKPSLPPYLEAALSQQYCADVVADILSGYAESRPVTFRVNPLRASADEADQALTQAGIVFSPVSWYEDARIADDVQEKALLALPLAEQGGIYLQNLSAMLPALLLAPQPGESVLDMCAAPGGKTTQLAALSGNQALITACERDRFRCERLRFNLDRQGATRVTVMQTDARLLDDAFRFDKILLDAPCTGSGTVSLMEGAPERRMDEVWVNRIHRTQQGLLDKAVRLLRQGGILVYATCSILKQENEAMAERAIASGLEPLPVPDKLRSSLELLPTSQPEALCLKPTRLQEGFFVAMFRKT